MKRSIISIDEETCIGCGLCISACEQGAIQLIDGKAKLISEDYCDGLGKCLPKCPVDAITLEEREADSFNEAKAAQRKKADSAAPIKTGQPDTLGCGCPGIQSKTIQRQATAENQIPVTPGTAPIRQQSALQQWPVQIKLVPVNAPYLENSHLLVAADCTAFAYANIHNDFMKNKVTIIGCPKLDEGDYTEKLAAILTSNTIKSLTVLRMEVPCCSGIANAAKNALIQSGTMIPWSIVTISTDGQILED